MKSELLFSAAGTIALMLSSCSADDPVAANTSEGAITYDVVADNQSRAAHSYCNNDKPDEFKIWAIHSEKPSVYYIADDKIQYSGGSYTDVNGTRYWPESGTLSFYAVVDCDNKAVATIDNTNKNKIAIENYVIKDDVNDQLDLMYAVKTNAAYDANVPVSLNFRHALSQICFKARNENPNIKIIINSVTVAGVYGQGTYTLPDTSTDGNYIQHDGTTSGSRPDDYNGWTPVETSTTDYTVALGSSGIEIPYSTTNATDLTCGNNANHTPETSTTTQWYAKALNLLPQAREFNEGVSFVLNLSIKANYDGATDEYTDTKYKNRNFSVPVKIDWKEGYRYIYTFIFPSNWSPDDNSLIRYDFTFDDFKEEPKDITIKNHYAVLMRAGDSSTDPLYVATTNIGAGTPQEAGLFFWYGATKGHPVNTDFLFYGGNPDIYTYGKTTNTLETENWITSAGILTSQHDAATNYWGGPWRMPTKEELEWLVDNCTWTIEKDATGTAIGYTVVSNSTKGSIFLPAAGFLNAFINENKTAYTNRHLSTTRCYYWSSTINTATNNYLAWRLRAMDPSDPEVGVGNPAVGVGNIGTRYDGFPLRPVAPSISSSKTIGDITPPQTTNP